MSDQRTLKPEVRSAILAALGNIPGMAVDRETRLSLLAGLNPTLALRIPASPVPETDLSNIPDAVTTYVDQATNRLGLAVLLNNAINKVPGTEMALTLTTIRDRLIAAPDQVVFTTV